MPGRFKVFALLLLAGCAAHPAGTVSDRPVQTASRPVASSGPLPVPRDPKSSLSLDQIEPAVSLNGSAASVDLYPPPPVESVRLFAQARLAVLDGRREQAAELLEQAVALDPAGFELHKSLGDLYSLASDARAVDEWEKAVDLRPDRLDLQIRLGRHYLDQGDLPKSTFHLRTALLTTNYRQEDPADGEADFLLARALQRQGYDRAALQMYERLLGRLTNPTFGARMNAQTAALVAHPDVLARHVAALYEKTGAYGPAVTLLRPLAVRAPADFDLQARFVRDSAAAGDRDGARRAAAELVGRFHADRPSLDLLKEVAGAEGEPILRQLHSRDPDDREIVYALVEVLRVNGRLQAADRVVAEAAGKWPDDLRLLRRQVDLLRAERKPAAAAHAVVTALSRQPDHALELAALWDVPAQASAGGRVRLADVQAMSVPTEAQGARQLLLARTARSGHRDGIERDALRRAVDHRPVFAPAWREMLALVWSDAARTVQEKARASAILAADAERAGAPGLASELRGQALLDEGRAEPAALQFAAAVKAGDRSAELYLNFAAALHDLSDDKGAESLLEKVVAERPLADEGYVELYGLYTKLDQPGQANRVLVQWLAADPDSVIARRLQARELLSRRQSSEAERVVLDLLDRNDSDPQTLAAVAQIYLEAGHADEVVTQFRQRLFVEPWNFALAVALADVYERQERVPEALQILRTARTAAAGDPDLLYSLSASYSRLGDSVRSEQVLADVLKIDPSYAGANNDLGYSWAERGRNLDAAETLVRRALRDEPDNLSFLDSMGWVLYKRGKFAEALDNLTRAANPPSAADPVVLGHLGDTLYRLGDAKRAADRWQQAVQRLADQPDTGRNDLRQLKVELQTKQTQIKAGRPVSVAPVGEK